MLPQRFYRIRKCRIVVVAATFFFLLTATAASSTENGGDDTSASTQRGLIDSTTAVEYNRDNVSADSMATDVEKQPKKSSGVLNSYLQGVGVQSLQNTVNKIRPPPSSITRAPAYNPASAWLLRPRPQPPRPPPPPEIDYFNPPTTRRYYRPDHLPPEIDYFNPPTTRRYYRPEQPPQGIDYFNQPTTRRYYRPDQLPPEINYFNPPTTHRYYRPEPPPPAPPPIDYYEQATTQRYHRPELPQPPTPPVQNNHEQTTRKYYSPELGPPPVRTEAPPPPKDPQPSTTATGGDSLLSLTPPSVFKTEEQKQAYQFLLFLEEQERQQGGKTVPPTTTKPPKPKLPHIIEVATTPEYDEYDDPDYGVGTKRISAAGPPTRKPRPVTPSAGNAPPPAYNPYQPPPHHYPQLENPTSRPSDHYHENFQPTSSAEIASPVVTPLPPLTPEQLHRIQLIVSIMKLREKQKEKSTATQTAPGEVPLPAGPPTQSPFEFVPRLVMNPYIPPTRLTTTTDNPSDAIQDLANLFGSLAVGNLAGVVDGTLKFAGTGVFNNLNTWNACTRGNCDQDDVKAVGSIVDERPQPTSAALPIPPHRHPVQNPYPGSVPGS